jgi:hypothetical protein
MSRDDFTKDVVIRIAKRAGWLCSYPNCRRYTVGAAEGSDSDEINIGTAAHICAAAPLGPRYDPLMTSAERKSVKNGIWMCRDHGKAIDSKDSEFTVALLRAWKKQIEDESRDRVLNQSDRIIIPTNQNHKTTEFWHMVTEDIEVFRRTLKWPKTKVNLTLEVDGLAEPVSTNALSGLVAKLDDLILIADPGMGKTTTLFQIADGLISNQMSAPIVVSLGDWATEDKSLIESILNRAAFSGASYDLFNGVVKSSGVVLLLDGWNELNANSRGRARIQLERLKAELPELGIVITTRKQMVDLPFDGVRIELLPLNEEQQLEIASEMRGAEGVEIIDKAWRQAGLRDLVRIPLYLTSLLQLPKHLTFPTTKDELLSHFVTVHESEPSKAEAFYTKLQNHQTDYLTGLAEYGMQSSSSTISELDAKRSIVQTGLSLAKDLLVVSPPQPQEILETLINNHILIRMGGISAFMFQHQQFQEWYASNVVEELILNLETDADSLNKLKVEIFNQPFWEEAILFAVERLSRGSDNQVIQCGKAILLALEVDPLLASDMIYRATSKVWDKISSNIQIFVDRWHIPDEVDRSFKFMLATGRPEFFNKIWPILTNLDFNFRFTALRISGQFRITALGDFAEEKIKGLPAEMREQILSEIVYSSEVNGLDFVVRAVSNDPDPHVQARVISSLTFRQANRHILQVLKQASDSIIDECLEYGYLDEIKDESLQQRINAAKDRKKNHVTDLKLLENISRLTKSEKGADQVFRIITAMDMEHETYDFSHVIDNTYLLYPEEVTNALLNRLREGQKLFYKADYLLAQSNLSLNDAFLVDIILSTSSDRDDESAAAASVLGPSALNQVIDKYIELNKSIIKERNKEEDALKRLRNLEALIARAPGSSLVDAISQRAENATIQEIAIYAELLSREKIRFNRPGLNYNDSSASKIHEMIIKWGQLMLSREDVKRSIKVSLVKLSSCVPSVKLIPILKELLDDNLVRFRGFRIKAEELHWQPSEVTDEARWSFTNVYHWAFREIISPDIFDLMKLYLSDEHFGEYASLVLVDQWKSINIPSKTSMFPIGYDFREVKDKYEFRKINPTHSTNEADLIFSVIGNLISEASSNKDKALAVNLGIHACSIPHGDRMQIKKLLLDLANNRSKISLLHAMVQSGDVIPSELIVNGITDILEESKSKQWLIDNDGYELKRWLVLLPFVDNYKCIMPTIRSLPEQCRTPYFLRETIDSFLYTPVKNCQHCLFEIAEWDTRLYDDNHWQSTVLQLQTAPYALKIIDLVCAGDVDFGLDEFNNLAREFAQLLDIVGVRSYVYQLIRNENFVSGISRLTSAVSLNPDGEGLLLLIQLEASLKIRLVSGGCVESVVTDSIPIEFSSNTFTVVPKSAPEIRAALLEMTTDGGSNDVATQYLLRIDSIRDEYGIPINEPRHPNIHSGKPWPMMRVWHCSN